MGIASIDHAFVIPAHGESPYLERCLESLHAQQTVSPVTIATRTATPGIVSLAREYGATVCVNNQLQTGIGNDWNFALQCTDAAWVTLAHQDDVYDPEFSTLVIDSVGRHDDAILVTTAYRELFEDSVRKNSSLMIVKKLLMEFGFAGSERARLSFAKQNTLRFGCAIGCPTATINMAKTQLRFRTDLKNNLDWAAWLQLSRTQGDFVYLRRPLMSHRIHRNSETTSGLDSGTRESEDRLLLRSFWPAAIADLIASTYGLAYRSNHV